MSLPICEYMPHKQLHVLLALAAFKQNGHIVVSTPKLARVLGTSQQSASRILIQLEKEGLIRREAGKEGQHITFTQQGKHLLQQSYAQLQHVLGLQQQQTIRGRVIAGFGEGKYYMSQAGYKKQFRQRLGYIPYEGTLNLRVAPHEGNKAYNDPSFFRIEGFVTKERNFGGLRCKKTIINGKVEGAIIIPDRTAHDAKTIEIIAPLSLRKKLKLHTGTLVAVIF